METFKAYTGIKFTLEQATKTQRGKRGIALLFLQPWALDGGGWSMQCPSLFTLRKGSCYPLYKKAVWAPGPVWRGVENLAPSRI